MFDSNMKEHLRFLARAADSIADGDLVDRCIRRGQKWSLLPVQVSARGSCFSEYLGKSQSVT